MKSLKSFLLLLFALESCTPIYFIEPQTGGGEVLTELPKEFIGSWNENDVTWELSKEGFQRVEQEVNSAGNTIDKVEFELWLSDTVKMYQSRRCYFLNYREMDKPWELSVFKKKWNGDIQLFENRQMDLVSADKKLKFVHAHYELDERDTLVDKMDPDYEFSSNLKSVTYAGQLSKRTIRKMTNKKFMLVTLKKDGTVVLPEDGEGITIE